MDVLTLALAKKSSWNDLTDKPFIPTSYNDLEEKPFGLIETNVEKIRLENLTANKQSETRFKATHLLMNGFTPEVGKKYTVSISINGGILYHEKEFVAQKPTTNIRLGTPDDEFYVECSTGLVTYYVYFTHFVPDNTATVTMCIYERDETFSRIAENYLPESVESVVVRSSTANSTKKFKLTVDDSGTITATEVTG